jgi:hypothetical protein
VSTWDEIEVDDYDFGDDEMDDVVNPEQPPQGEDEGNDDNAP